MTTNNIHRHFIRLLINFFSRNGALPVSREKSGLPLKNPEIKNTSPVRFSGFTLMEITVTIIIIGILASIALPNYSKTVEVAHVNDATVNALALHAAQMAYRSEFAGFYPPGVGTEADLNVINNDLGLSIIANGFNYSCTSSVPDAQGHPTQFICEASRVGGGNYGVGVDDGVIVTDHTAPNPNPFCTDGTGNGTPCANCCPGW